jgi:hypothetical protein
MDQSLSPFARSLGEEGQQLPLPVVFRLRHHLLAQVRALEIGSKVFVRSLFSINHLSTQTVK